MNFRVTMQYLPGRTSTPTTTLIRIYRRAFNYTLMKALSVVRAHHPKPRVTDLIELTVGERGLGRLCWLEHQKEHISVHAVKEIKP